MKNFEIEERAPGLCAKLIEVGRKISKANADRLKKAMQEMSDLLAQVELEAEPEVTEATEAALEGDCLPLVEAALAEAATADIKLIAPGWGSSGYYPAKTLQQAASVFSKGVKMFWNHQTAAEEASRPEGDLSHLAGELLEDSRWEAQGSAGPGLYAKAKVFDRFKDAVKDLAPHIGVSIRASGFSKQGEAEGRKGPVIERIAAARSVDFVTVPGAGGQIVNLFEAAGRRPVAKPTTEEKPEMDKAEIMALIAESQKPLQESLTAATADNARLREALALRDGRDFVVRKLATITMPDATRTRLTESLTPRAILKDGRLDEAAFGTLIETTAKAEMEYLQGIAGGSIRGMGSAPVTEAAKVTDADLIAEFRELGMSEAAAKIAVEGRAA